MIRAARLAAVIAPVLGLAALWGMSDRTYNQGTQWEVPIEGYDPRDYLRGHYVEFSYDWPGLELDQLMGPQQLCLEGAAPWIDRVTVPDIGPATGPAAGPATVPDIGPSEVAAPCAHLLKAQDGGVYGTSALLRGRLYIGQDRAAKLDAQLRSRDQRGIITIRQREDGSFTPIAIRFRPLTPTERAERDAQDALRAGDLRPPPPMMSQ